MNDENLLISNLAKNHKKPHPSNQGKGTYERVDNKNKIENVLDNQIEYIRQAVFMPVTELCRKASITYPNYNAIVSGNVDKPQTKTMIRIALALGVDPPCDIFIFPNEELRAIVHKAWINLIPEEQQQIAMEDNSSPKNTTISLEYGLRVPNEYSDENAREVIRTVYEFIEQKEEVVTSDRFHGLMQKWIENVSSNPNQDNQRLNVVINEMLGAGD